jgi:pyrimidine operon attenuation protein/uracil phosphoribosyltransferase
MKELILDHQKIAHTIRRIAFQILETYSDESEIIIAGIQGSGSLLGRKNCHGIKKN